MFGKKISQFSGLLIAVALFSAGLLASGMDTGEARGAPSSFADIAEGLMPAVVNISISTTVENARPRLEGTPFEDFFEDFLEPKKNGPVPKKRVSSLGSGFVIDPSGIVVTNNHVIENAEEITVNFSNGDKYDAELLGRDPKTDLAVLKIITKKQLPFVRFGDNTKARVGDWVIAIGNPFGLGGSLSVGVISAINRDINSGPYDSYIQTDAAINKGNSGGPLFNLDGEVIGVNTAIISPTGGSVGIGFSIPADMAQNVIAQLRDFGETRRGWLGVRIQQVTDDLADGLQLADAKGALVSEVIPEGPADRAGMKQGDVILRFDDKEVVEMRDLPRIVAETPIDKTVRVKVSRRGKLKQLNVKVGRLEETGDVVDASTDKIPGKEGADETVVMGLSLSPLDDQSREKSGLEAGKNGVLIAAIDPDSAAASSNIRVGNVIIEVDQQAVSQPAEVKAIVEKARQAGKKSVLVLVHARQGLRFIALRIDG